MASRLWDSAYKTLFGSGSSSSTRASGGASTSPALERASSFGGSNKTDDSHNKNSKPTTSTSFFDLSPYFDSSAYYWNYANDSVNYASETTYLTLASMLSNFYAPDLFGGSPALPSTTTDADNTNATPIKRRSTFLLRMADRRYASPSRDNSNKQPQQQQRTSPQQHVFSPSPSPAAGISSWSVLTKNPYNIVRGRQPINHRRQSISAVRSFLALVPVDEEEGQGDEYSSDADFLDPEAALVATPPPLPPATHTRAASFGDSTAHSQNRTLVVASKDETASQVAEGTLRALRDLALEEALELNTALRFWSNRWERPLLSWFEAGPLVWTSPVGYRHRLVGERVAQLQAVLARRCAAIGELQEHLLRAGWQQGVAQWGVLDQFQTVSGVDGSIKHDPQEANHLPPLAKVERSRSSIMTPNTDNNNKNNSLSPSPSMTSHTTTNNNNASLSAVAIDDSASRGPLRRSSSHVGEGADQPKTAHVLVRKGNGAGIYTDHPSFVAEWAVEAIALVRRHLYRASNGMVELPYESNWLDEEDFHQGDMRALPVWVTRMRHKAPSIDEEDIAEEDDSSFLKVTDLNLMMTEVSELLNVMEDIMMLQRQRRLERMRAPGWLRRNWFLVATFGPAALWMLYTGRPRAILSNAMAYIRHFVNERFVEPFFAIVNEVLKGRENFSNPKARADATYALKQMIKNWLDETYPQMAEHQRIALAEAMDMRLIEEHKTESMRTFFEINKVIQMSFIEMQYMKREMMNALAGMDEVMSANDINMNVAAITPMLAIVYFNVRLFRFLYHAVLRLGRSREETYADFRTILIDIERLLVMRDSPPDIYRQPKGGELTASSCCILSPDDLGMLMLLIHELRTILMRERRRFTRDEIRGVSEDLAELAGERGAVSVRQQLQILTRMSRTYSFLKVLSTGTLFRH